MKKFFTRFPRALGVGLLFAGMSVCAPALAADDGYVPLWTGLMEMAGFGAPKEEVDIAYRERPPLVVPPRLDLPKPKQSVEVANPAWPEDTDKARARKKAEIDPQEKWRDFIGGKRTLPASEMAGNGKQLPPMAKPITEPNPCEGREAKAECQRVDWKSLEGEKIISPDREVPVALGDEPTRDNLTDPPVGYRKVTKLVKMSQDKKDDKNKTLSPREYIVREAQSTNRTDDE